MIISVYHYCKTKLDFVNGQFKTVTEGVSLKNCGI